MLETHLINQLDDTQNLARRVADRLTGGSHVGLHGPLGAGKTTFVQFLAAELGAQQRPDSPSFILRRAYPIQRGGRWLVHADLYRLDEPVSLTALAETNLLEDWADPETITIVEWIDRAPSLAADLDLCLTFQFDPDTNQRLVQIAARP